jgi:hypothetical protein
MIMIGSVGSAVKVVPLQITRVTPLEPGVPPAASTQTTKPINTNVPLMQAPVVPRALPQPQPLARSKSLLPAPGAPLKDAKTARSGSLFASPGSTRTSGQVQAAVRQRPPLTPADVKKIATSTVPLAEKRIEQVFGKYVTSRPKLELALLNKEGMKARKHAPDVFASVDSRKPSKIEIGIESDIFKKFPDLMTARGTKVLLAHEVLHTRSTAFALDIANTYGKPQSNGKVPTFSDGTRVRDVTEGFTERFTKEMLNVDSTPAAYGKPNAWANKVVDIVGDDTAKKAYFSHDPAAMKQVKAAIDQLVVTDKFQQRAETPRTALK